MKEIVTTRMDKDLIEELNFFSKELGISKSSIMERAFIKYIDELDVKYADKVTKAIQEGKMKTYLFDKDKFLQEIGLTKEEYDKL